MRPTIDYIKDKFEYYNELCFEGMLPMPPIRLNMRYGIMGITKSKVTMSHNGKLHHDNISIEISVRRDLPEEEYIDTLLHEMIHYYIAYNDIIDDSPHGAIFKEKMDYIQSKFGIKISIAFDPSDEYLVNTITRIRYVCVAEFEDERMGLAVVAKNRIFLLWDMIPKLQGVKSVTWYVSNRAIFERFQVVVSPRLYIEDSDRIHHYLTGAKQMVRNNDTITVLK